MKLLHFMSPYHLIHSIATCLCLPCILPRQILPYVTPIIIFIYLFTSWNKEQKTIDFSFNFSFNKFVREVFGILWKISEITLDSHFYQITMRFSQLSKIQPDSGFSLLIVSSLSVKSNSGRVLIFET